MSCSQSESFLASPELIFTLEVTENTNPNGNGCGKKTSQHEELRGTQGLEGNVWGRNLSRDPGNGERTREL